MEKYKNIFILILFSFIQFGCTHTETHQIDITQFVWKITKVKYNEKVYDFRKQDCYNSEAYTLIFRQKNIFQLNTSVNLAVGNYVIEPYRLIRFSNYQCLTEIGGDNEMDLLILQLVPEVISYKKKNDHLHLYGEDFEIVLVKL